MRARNLSPLLVAALFVSAPPSAVAKPKSATKTSRSKPRARKRSNRPTTPPPAPTNPTGAGERIDGLQYIALGHADFVPRNLTDGDTRRSAITGIRLPQGARVRTLACFGSWNPAENKSYGVLLRRHSHAASGSETLAAAGITGGEGRRRIEGEADHVVDNFLNFYQVEMMVKSKANLYSCRVGYELPS